MSKFIVFEGVDGSGKSTVLSSVVSELIDPVKVTREPYGIVQSCSVIYDTLHHPALDDSSGRTELALVLASRAENITKVIEPSLEAGETVLCDRFAESTMAYQGFGRGLPMEELERVVYSEFFYIKPDLTVIFDVPIEVAMKRSENRGQGDKFDRESEEFFNRVREYYLTLSNKDGYVVIDSSRPLESVVEATVRRIKAVL
jgi:dTMP kinase